jgi:AraC-like DNA-binding protein
MPLKKWVEYIKTNLFSEHEGFYELPYLSNDPQVMVHSIIDIAVAEQKPPEQAIYTNNAYFKGVMRYQQVDDGLWILGTHLDIKKNIVGKALYDAEKISDYYFLSFAVFEYRFPVNDSFTSFGTLQSITCTFYRPLTQVDTFFYENTKGKFFNIIFNKSWVQKNIVFKSTAEKNNMLEILDGKACFMNRFDMVPDAAALSEGLWAALEKGKTGQVDNNQLKEQMQQTIGKFFSTAFETQWFKNYTVLHNADYLKLAAAEKIILHNLAVPFVGVEFIAKAVKLSPTKLKMIFKTVYGFSMLQYHKEKNMLLAMQLVLRSEMQVKNIALVTGFESAGKFTAAFKKRFSKLPTAYRNT